MKIIVATDSFKGSLSAEKACDIIAKVLAGHDGNAEIITRPMADGGEGTADAMIASCEAEWVTATVMGPLPDMEVRAGFAWLPDSKTALVEMAKASGIILLKQKQLDPLRTTTYGTGQLIVKALEKRPEEILLAIGGSATVDAGIGAAMAMGWQFLDEQGEPVTTGGAAIEKIADIIPPEHKITADVKVLSDVDNPLYGPNGAAEIFGPQKGADPETVKRLDKAIEKMARLVKEKLNIDIADIPGAGAAGGLGAGGVAFMNAEIVSGIEEIIKTAGLRADLQKADWVITGEGRFDGQSLRGKVVSGVLKCAQQTGAKTAVIAGEVLIEEPEYKKIGIADAIGLKKDGMTTAYAIENCENLLEKTAREFIKRNLR